MTKNTRKLVITVGYLIGIRVETLRSYFGDDCNEVLDALQKDDDATAIHYLCKLRTTLMLNFKKTDNAMVYDLLNLDRMEWFCSKDIKWLTDHGYLSIKANYRADKYMVDINELILKHVDKCSKLFYDWQRWDLIRKLMIIPKYNNPQVMKEEFAKYMANREVYPFQVYICWEPRDLGNLLYDDGKFIRTLHLINNETFQDVSNCRDACSETKQDIYNFVGESDRVALIVDCENSDVYKLVGMLQSLNADELSKVEKIVLYDDEHTTPGWDWMDKFTHIPVEHIEVPRVNDRKSLVDIKLTAGVCNDFYKNGISSFIIASSDSDYWGLISSLPDADFLVVYEYSKCGNDIKEALEEHDYYYCCLDDFCTGNIEPFKKVVLFNLFKNNLPDLSGYNSKEITRSIYEEARIYASDKEIQNFYDKYVKTIKLAIDKDGNFDYEFNN